MVATRRMSIQEFEAMPLEGSWELIDGELVEVSPNAGDSGWIAGQIVFLLESHARSDAVGWVFSPTSGSSCSTAAPSSAHQMPRSSGGIDCHVPRPLAPDRAVEVLSPTDCRPDTLAKVAMYLQAGVHLVWLVDPGRLTITVFRPDDTIEVLRENDMLEGGDVLPGFSVAAAQIFGSPDS